MPEWLGWVLAPGVLTVILGIGYKLHQDAVQSQRERADDWRATAQAAQKLNEVYREQIAILLGGNGSRDEVVAKANGGRRRRRGTGQAGSPARGGKGADAANPQGRSGGRRSTR